MLAQGQPELHLMAPHLANPTCTMQISATPYSTLLMQCHWTCCGKKPVQWEATLKQSTSAMHACGPRSAEQQHDNYAHATMPCTAHACLICSNKCISCCMHHPGCASQLLRPLREHSRRTFVHTSLQGTAYRTYNRPERYKPPGILGRNTMQ
jgi:hypothetical protein